MENKFINLHLLLLIPLSIVVLNITACGKPTESTNTTNSGSAPVATNKALIFDNNIGWLHGSCIAIKNKTLKPGTKITLIKLGDRQTTIKTELSGIAAADTGCFALFSDRVSINQNDNRSFYAVKLPKSELNIMAISLIGTDIVTSIKNNTVSIDIDADGINEFFDSCETSEGIKFFVWSGAVNQGTARWSDYYYLGYDMKPTCPVE